MAEVLEEGDRSSHHLGQPHVHGFGSGLELTDGEDERNVDAADED